MARNERERDLLVRLLRAMEAEACEETAAHLLDRFGSLCQVLDCPRDALAAVSSLSPSETLLLTSIPELARVRAMDQVGALPAFDRLERVKPFVRAAYVGAKRERFMMIGLDEHYRMVSCDCLSEGSLQETSLSTRSLLRMLTAAPVCAVLFCHNHPNGMTRFSISDLESTRVAMKFMKTLDIAMVDHLLVIPQDIISLRKGAMIAEKMWMDSGSGNLTRDAWLSSGKMTEEENETRGREE